MKRYTFAILFFCYFAYSLGMQENCTHIGFQYRDGTSFLSVKADGSRYSCNCRLSSIFVPSSCREIRCYLISGPTAKPLPTIDPNDPEEERPIEGEVPSSSTPQTDVATSTFDSGDLIPIYIPASGLSQSGEHCLDEESDRKFSVGDTFYRLIPNGRIRKECQCRMVSGMAKIVCTDATCKLRDPPTQVANTGEMRYGDCYDPWQARRILNGEVYNRTRYMDVRDSVTGVYRCTCTKGLITCDALDIPCCNMETGDFVERGSRFITRLGRMALDCECHRGRARFSNCKAVSFSNGQSQEYPYLQYREARCSHRHSPGRTYSVGQSWTQYRNGSERWTCRCLRSGNTLRARCTMIPSRYIGSSLVPLRYGQSRYTQSRYVSPVRRPIGRRRFRPGVPVQRPVRIYSSSYHGNAGK